MNFWSYSFIYIFRAYQKWGEKYSAHIYALCILTVLLCVNLMSVFFIMMPDEYMRSRNFKQLAITVFAALLALNAIYFLGNRRYLKMAAEYEEMNNKSKLRMKIAFWSYFVVTILVLVIALNRGR